MKAERLLLIMIVATAILVTPGVLTSPVLAQNTTDTAADDESPSDMYEEFQACLENEERTGANIGFVLEGDIRACFIDAGYTGNDDDNSE
jgi:hypothetical protein